MSQQQNPSRYDPVPDLAALLDGITALFGKARLGASNADLVIGLGMLAADRYAGLRGGLLLDEPGREEITTEQAIREALTDIGWAQP